MVRQYPPGPNQTKFYPRLTAIRSRHVKPGRDPYKKIFYLVAARCQLVTRCVARWPLSKYFFACSSRVEIYFDFAASSSRTHPRPCQPRRLLLGGPTPRSHPSLPRPIGRPWRLLLHKRQAPLTPATSNTTQAAAPHPAPADPSAAAAAART